MAKLILFLLTLFSCPALALTPNALNGQWHTHRDHIRKQFTGWMVKGKAGIVTPDKGYSADLMWKLQAHNRYVMRLTGPAGQGAVHLVAKPSFVSLTTSDGERRQANTARSLLWENLGWDLPVNKAHYWIRGIPAPGHYLRKINNHGLLTLLKQDGWTVTFDDYTDINGFTLPQRLTAENPRFKLKLVKLKWEVQHDAEINF